jgi:hypothetical protein
MSLGNEGMNVRFGADTDPFVAGVGRMQGSLLNLNTSIEIFGRRSVLLLSGIAAAALKLAGNFDKSLAQLNSVLRASEEDLGRYRRAILSLAVESGKPPSELAAAFTQAARAGMADLGLLRTATQLSRDTFSDLDSSMRVLTQTIAVWGGGTAKATEYADKLTAASRKSRVSIEDFGRELGDVQSLAKGAGVSFDELLNSFAVLSRAGIAPGKAAGLLRQTILGTISPEEAENLLSTLTQGLKEQAEALDTVADSTANAADAMTKSQSRLLAQERAWAALKAALISYGTVLAQELQPLVESLADALGAVSDAFEAARGDAATFGSASPEAMEGVVSAMDTVALSVVKVGLLFRFAGTMGKLAAQEVSAAFWSLVNKGFDIEQWLADQMQDLGTKLEGSFWTRDIANILIAEAGTHYANVRLGKPQAELTERVAKDTLRNTLKEANKELDEYEAAWKRMGERSATRRVEALEQRRLEQRAAAEMAWNKWAGGPDAATQAAFIELLQVKVLEGHLEKFSQQTEQLKGAFQERYAAYQGYVERVRDLQKRLTEVHEDWGERLLGARVDWAKRTMSSAQAAQFERAEHAGAAQYYWAAGLRSQKDVDEQVRLWRQAQRHLEAVGDWSTSGQVQKRVEAALEKQLNLQKSLQEQARGQVDALRKQWNLLSAAVAKGLDMEVHSEAAKAKLDELLQKYKDIVLDWTVNIHKQEEGVDKAARGFQHGGPSTDYLPAWLSSGEYVVNRQATRLFEPLLAAMNAAGMGRTAGSASQGWSGNLVVNINAHTVDRETVRREVIPELVRARQRGVI